MDVVTSNTAIKILVLNLGRFTTADEAVALVQLDWMGSVGAAAGIAHALAKSRSDRPASDVGPVAIDRSSGAGCLGVPPPIGRRRQFDRHHRLVVG